MQLPDVDVTGLLAAWSAGDQSAFDKLVPLVHDELRRLARRYLAGERPDAGAQTTELVNEAYLRLVECSRVRWQDRCHFFAIAAQMMRRVLVDLARAEKAEKRGGGTIRIVLDENIDAPAPDWIALDEALRSLEAIDQRKGRMVELRFFGGLGVDETAQMLGVSPETIHRDWKFARTWLRKELTRGAA